MATELSLEQQKLVNFIRLNPGATVNEVAIMLERPNPSSYYQLKRLIELGYLRRVECRSESNRNEYKYYLCGTSTSQTQENNTDKPTGASMNTNDTNTNKCYQSSESKQKPNLENYTPRELMIELKKRGYTGKLKLVTIREVDFEKL